MSAPRYVITIGTTPLPRGVVVGRHARRRSAVVYGAAVYGAASRAPGVHRAGRGAHRGHVAVDPSYGPGRHRARTRVSPRTAIIRTALPTLLVLAAAALFLTAWMSASDAVAFASIVQP